MFSTSAFASFSFLAPTHPPGAAVTVPVTTHFLDTILDRVGVTQQIDTLPLFLNRDSHVVLHPEVSGTNTAPMYYYSLAMDDYLTQTGVGETPVCSWFSGLHLHIFGQLVTIERFKLVRQILGNWFPQAAIQFHQGIGGRAVVSFTVFGIGDGGTDLCLPGQPGGFLGLTGGMFGHLKAEFLGEEFSDGSERWTVTQKLLFVGSQGVAQAVKLWMGQSLLRFVLRAVCLMVHGFLWW